MKKCALILACAGRGRRLERKVDKAFVSLGGIPLFLHSLRVYASIEAFSQLIVVTRKTHVSSIRRLFNDERLLVVTGGRRRQDSVLNGLQHLDASIEYVIIHDGARPFITKKSVVKLLAALSRYPAATVATPAKDALKIVAKGIISQTVNRKNIWNIQTPQAFRKDILQAAFRRFKKVEVYDETQLIERLGKKIKIIEGTSRNMKITYPEDLAIAQAVIQRQTKMKRPRYRIGIGLDLHAFSRRKKALLLAGVTIAGARGLQAVSDGDVVLHAICDGILGASACGDIGDLFPPKAKKSQGISSRTIAKAVVKKIKDTFTIVNIDVTLIADTPPLAAHKKRMKASLAKIFSHPAINIKIKSKEKTYFLGGPDTISCVAAVLLKKC